VEPHGVAALLVPTVGSGEELEPELVDSTVAFAPVALWSVVSITDSSSAAFVAFVTMALSAAAFTTAAFSAAFATTASSAVLISAAFSAATAAVETSLAVEADLLLPNPLGATDAATLGSGRGVVATPGACYPDNGGPLTVDPPLRSCLILLCRGTSSSSDDTLVSLSTI
jgi:hypothetical protein